MCNVIGTKNLDGLVDFVWGVHVIDWRGHIIVSNAAKLYMTLLVTCYDGEGFVVARISKSNPGTWGDAESGDIFMRYVKCDGNGKQCPVSEP